MDRAYRSLLFLLLLATAPTASAQEARRVVVSPITGPQGGAVRAALIRDLEENGVTVVPESEVRAARSELGISGRLSGEQYTQLAQRIHVSAFLEGRVVRRRRAWAATIRVRNAADGRDIGSESWGGSTAASLGGVGRNGYARLSDHLEATAAPAPPAEPPPPPVVEVERRRPVHEEPVAPPPAPPSTRYDAFRISVVGGTLFRSMDTEVSVYAAHRNMTPPNPESEFFLEPRRYQSGGIGHFELGVQGELYPGAFDTQPFPYLGLLVSFTHSIGVVTLGQDPTTGVRDVPVPTEQLDLLIAARGRYRFGEDRREPELHFDLGWGTFVFDLGLEELMDIARDTIIPPMEHGYVQIGAGISYGIVPVYLNVGLDIAARIGTNIGGSTRNVWGIDTSPSNGFLIGLHVRTEIPEIVEGAFIALHIEFFQFITNFEGQVGCAAAMCPYIDPWDDMSLWEVWPVTPPPAGQMANLNDVVGGPQGDVSDNYFRLQLAAGYAFH